MLDLGVWFDEKLLFSKHIQTKINKANMMLGIIKRNLIEIERTDPCCSETESVTAQIVPAGTEPNHTRRSAVPR